MSNTDGDPGESGEKDLKTRRKKERVKEKEIVCNQKFRRERSVRRIL